MTTKRPKLKPNTFRRNGRLYRRAWKRSDNGFFCTKAWADANPRKSVAISIEISPRTCR